jgi:hypothetical protein
MRGGKLTLALQGWLAFLAYRYKLQTALFHLTQSACIRAMQMWCDWTVAKILSRERQALADDFLARFCARDLEAAFYDWLAFVSDSWEQSLLARQVCMCVRARLCVRVCVSVYQTLCLPTGVRRHGQPFIPSGATAEARSTQCILRRGAHRVLTYYARAICALDTHSQRRQQQQRYHTIRWEQQRHHPEH